MPSYRAPRLKLPCVNTVITSDNVAIGTNEARSLAGTVKSATVRVSCRPRSPAGWLMANCSGEMPERSIHTTARASPMVMATAVQAMGAKLRRHTSRSTESSITTSQPAAIEEVILPNVAMRAVPRRLRWGRIPAPAARRFRRCWRAGGPLRLS